MNTPLENSRRDSAAAWRLFVSLSKPVCVLDEPFTALDVASVANLAAAVAEHVMAGGIVIYTTHQEVEMNLPVERTKTVDVSSFAPGKRVCGEVRHA